MEPIMLFSAVILAVAAMHLISRSVDALRGRDAFRRAAHKTTKRADWYMFFKLSDLLGKDEPKDVGATHRQEKKAPQIQRRPVKRLQL